MSDPHYGWECPRCNCVHAPWISSCSCRTAKVPVPPEPDYMRQGLQQQTAQHDAYTRLNLKGFGQQ